MKKTVSPTKVGKVQNKSSGVDFGTKFLEGSGSDIFKKLPPKVRKQIKSQVAKFEDHMDSLIEEKRQALKEMLNDEAIELQSEVESLVKDAITEYIPEEILNDVESIVTGEKSIDDVAEGYANKYSKKRQPPNTPLISLPDNLPTEDPMGDIVPDIEKAIEEAVCEALVGILRILLKELKNIVDDLRKGKLPDFGKALDKLGDELIDAFKDAFKEAFKGISDFADMLGDQLEELLEEFIKDVLGSLTGAETADLLKGNPSEEVKQHINSVLQHKHPEIKEAIKDTTDIENVFSKAGDILGEEVVEELREPAVFDEDSISTSGLLCDDDIVEGDLGSVVYGNRLSGERAKQQDRAEKDRLKDLVKKLSEMVDENPLDSIPTDLSCAENLMPKNIPALSHANDSVIEFLFSSIQMAFSRDLMGIKNSLIQSEAVEASEEDPVSKFQEPDENDNKIMAALGAVTTKREVAPGLRTSLRSKKTFEMISSDDEPLSLKFLSSAVKVKKQSATEDPVVLSLKKQIDSGKKKLKAIDEDIEELKEELGDDFPVPSTMSSQKNKLQGDEDINGSIKQMEKMLEEVLKTSIELQKTNQHFVVDGVESIIYNISPVTKDPQVYKDAYTVDLVNTPFLDKQTEPFSSFESETEIQNPLNISPSEELGENNIFQAHAFASFIMSRLNGADIQVSNDIEKTFMDSSSSGIYGRLFVDFIKKAAKQTAASPLFNIEKLEELKVLPNYSPTSLCAPSSLESQDFLDLASIIQDVKDSYEGQCEPLDKKPGELSVFETEVRFGIVKTTVRLFMVETIIKSIFCFTEWSPKSLLGERLFIDFIFHKLKTELKNFNPMFYRDMCFTAKDIIENMLKSGQEVEDTYGVLDLDKILDEENPEYEYGEEDLKYVALQQLPDLLNRVEDRLGSPSKPLDKRFTDPPPQDRRLSGTETTPPGINLSPAPDGGWIRTIDVPANHIYGGEVTSLKQDSNKIVFAQQGNRFLRSALSNQTTDQKELTQVLSLRYPELLKNCGTFFVEKYIRVEDKTQISATAGESLSGIIRTRNGGPLESAEQEDINIDHTAGVVNISAWVNFLKKTKSELVADEQLAQEWTAAQVSDFFKPIRYGLRLVWVPPMNTNGATVLLTKNQTPSDTNAVSNLNTANNTLSPEQKQKELFDNSGELSSIEEELFKSLSKPENVQIFRREKAYITQEELFTSSGAQSVEFKKIVRPVFTMPLIAVESDIEEGLTLDDMTKPGFFDLNSDIDINPESPLAKLRADLTETEEYKFLFDYVFPIKRFSSLVTIYNSNSLSLMNPNINNVFNDSKEVCKSLYYTMSIDAAKEWWNKEDETVAELGGNAGLLQRDMMNQTVKGPSINLAAMASMTVPIIIRAMADRFDPHYQFTGFLQNLGVPYIKQDYTSLLPLWPSNYPFGWGPPITMWGTLAYGMPMLEGDKRRTEENDTDIKSKKDPEAECEDQE